MYQPKGLKAKFIDVETFKEGDEYGSRFVFICGNCGDRITKQTTNYAEGQSFIEEIESGIIELEHECKPNEDEKLSS